MRYKKKGFSKRIRSKYGVAGRGRGKRIRRYGVSRGGIRM